MSFEPTSTRWIKVRLMYSDFAVGSSQYDLKIYDLQPYEIVHSSQAELITAFVGGSTTTPVISTGITGTLNKFMTNKNILSLLSPPAAETTIRNYPESFSTIVDVRASLSVATGRLNELTQGELVIHLKISSWQP